MGLVQKITPMEPRHLDPDAPLENQLKVFMSLVKSPPTRSVILSVSPELAAWLLQNMNHGNRRKKPAYIKRYTTAMEEGCWALTGETLIFGTDGRVLDGQNRLSACTIAGVSFRSHVVFGIDPKVFDVINSGKARTNEDVFTTAGIVPAGTHAATRWLRIYSQREPGRAPDRSLSFENRELLRFYKQEVDQALLKDCMGRAYVTKTKAVIPPPVLAAHLYLFRKVDGVAASTFVKDLVRLGRKHKLAVAIEKVLTANSGRIHETHRNALIIKAWNAVRAGRKVLKDDLDWEASQGYPEYA